ncbi:MAG: PPOX class F420-dependent oxidoreductase [Gaiellaceae bacterium]
MPKLPLPPEADALLRRVNPAVIATLLPSGAPHTAVTWFDWDGERVLVNMDSTRLRLANLRRDPRASLTVIDAPDWYRQLTLFGRVDEIRDDTDFADIDRLSLRYSRRTFGNRVGARISALIVPERWYGWEGSSHWP